jgi:hypothetical protein
MSEFSDLQVVQRDDQTDDRVAFPFGAILSELISGSVGEAHLS